MELKETLDALRTYGVALFVVAFGFYVFVKHAIPFVVERVKVSEQLSRDMMEASQTRWAEYSRRSEDISREVISVLKEERSVLEAMARDMDKLRTDASDTKSDVRSLLRQHTTHTERRSDT